MVRGTRRMEKKKFGFVRVNAKSNAGEPLATERGDMLEFCDDAGKGFAGHENAAIINVKGEVGVPRAPKTKLE